MEDVKLLDAGPEGTVLFEILTDEKYGNINGVMHGGAAGVIFDMCTTMALAPLSKPGYWLYAEFHSLALPRDLAYAYSFLGGVTRILNIAYLRAVPVGTTIRIRSWVTQVGRTMAMIRSEMTSVDGKTIFATCEHHKVNVPTRPEHIDARLPWDDEQEKELQEEMERKAKREVKL